MICSDFVAARDLDLSAIDLYDLLVKKYKLVYGMVFSVIPHMPHMPETVHTYALQT